MVFHPTEVGHGVEPHFVAVSPVVVAGGDEGLHLSNPGVGRRQHARHCDPHRSVNELVRVEPTDHRPADEAKLFVGDGTPSARREGADADASMVPSQAAHRRIGSSARLAIVSGVVGGHGTGPVTRVVRTTGSQVG